MRRAVLLATLVVLAGCTGPFGLGSESTTERTEPTPTDAPATPTPDGGTDGSGTTDAPDGTDTGDGPESDPLVSVEGAELDANASDLFLRTRAALNADTEPPTVVVTSSPDIDFPEAELSTFRALFLPSVDPDATRDRDLGGDWPTSSPALYFPDTHTVYVNPVYVDNRRVDIGEILLEEFAHAVQFRNETFREYYDPLVDGLQFRPGLSVDERLTTIAVREGVGDVYVTARVQEESLGTPPSETIGEAVDTRYNRLGVGFRLSFGPYLFGYEYAERNLDGPRSTFGVYADPPETGEQVLHDTDEPPTDLTVRVDGDLERERADTYGELFLRPALSSELNRSAAARAADGWGNDRLLNLTYDAPVGTTSGFVWVLDWDDRGEREEFQRLFAEYVADRGRFVGDGRYRFENRQWTVRTLDADTVAVVVGSETFLDAVAVTATGNDTVTVDTSDGRRSAVDAGRSPGYGDRTAAASTANSENRPIAGSSRSVSTAATTTAV